LPLISVASRRQRPERRARINFDEVAVRLMRRCRLDVKIASQLRP
jgi:hypothetical protein